MNTVANLRYYTDEVLAWGLVALRAWALLDCLLHKAAAFPAVDKLTKPAWIAMLALGGFLGSFLSVTPYPNPTEIISLISTVVASVYLADVRPAVREVSGGR